MRVTLRSSIAHVLVFAACGSSGMSHGADAGSGDPGSGTKTLYAAVGLSASSVDGGSEVVVLDVELARTMRGGPSVSGATVTLTASGGVTVTATEDAMIPGMYEASGFAWQPTWQVQITAGSDEVQATVQAPGETTVTSPTNGATVAAGDLTVQWTDAFGAHAQSVWADPGNGAPIVQLTDSGSGSVPVTATSVVTIYRQDAEDLAGGVTGSLATATTSYGVYVQVQ